MTGRILKDCIATHAGTASGATGGRSLIEAVQDAIAYADLRW
jgi:hypothetical protein